MGPLGASTVLLVGAALACGLPEASSRARPASESGPAFAGRLTVQLGCDEILVARDAESTVVLAVEIPGILERSRGAELPFREELRVGQPGIVVRLEQGADLDHWCTDVMARPPRIDAAWTGVSGVAVVELIERRAGGAAAARGSRPVPTAAVVRLRSAVLAREDRPQERLQLPPLEIAATLGEPGGG